MGDMDEIVKEFLVESGENLDQLDRDLVTLEKNPTAHEVLASIFRTIHTIKGTSGFLGFSRLESVAHVGESLLSRLRDGQLLLNAEITSGLLSLGDAVRQMLMNIEDTGQEGEGDYSSWNRRGRQERVLLKRLAEPPRTALALRAMSRPSPEPLRRSCPTQAGKAAWKPNSPP